MMQNEALNEIKYKKRRLLFKLFMAYYVVLVYTFRFYEG